MEFAKNQILLDRYKVLFDIHQTTFGHSYRVKDLETNELIMLKVYDSKKLQDWHYTDEAKSTLYEVEIHKELDHPNISKFGKCIKENIDGVDYFFYFVKFISGETLQARIDREGPIHEGLAKSFIEKISNAVNHLHQNGIIHGDVTPLNIMLDMSKGSIEPILIDFGLASFEKDDFVQMNETLPSVLYCSNERFEGVNNIQSEIFSLGSLYYTMIHGYVPWSDNLKNKNINSESFKSDLSESRKNKLLFSTTNLIDKHVKNSIIVSTLLNLENRYDTVNLFIESVTGKKVLADSDIKELERSQIVSKCIGEGFSKIAGMDDLKNLVRKQIIEPLRNPDIGRDYNIEPPNAILLYGPPGCGKTFFAKCLAEELGFNFMDVNPSDVGSKFVHGGQEKIKNLFDTAKENAPTIIFLDEIEAMIPNREGEGVGHHYASEVNEWLVQFNNCSHDDIFIIAATNRRDKLDPAILRSGRFDRKILIPVPDFDSRVALFNLELNKRKKKLGDNISVDKLASMTQDFASSDITLIVNDSSRIAYENSSNITQQIIEDVINNTSSSVTKEDINRYSQSDETSSQRRKIGFQFESKVATVDNSSKAQELEIKLKKAIQDEDYLLAAELKSQIEKLKNNE